MKYLFNISYHEDIDVIFDIVSFEECAIVRRTRRVSGDDVKIAKCVGEIVGMAFTY